MDAMAPNWPGVGNWNFAGSWFGDFPPTQEDDDEDEDDFHGDK